MVHRALTWIAGSGPATEQDRWEEDAGINAFTLAVCISALVCGARYLAEPARSFALMLADYWNSRIEAWTTVRDSHARAGVRCRGLLHSLRAAGGRRQRRGPEARAADQELPC